MLQARKHRARIAEQDRLGVQQNDRHALPIRTLWPIDLKRIEKLRFQAISKKRLADLGQLEVAAQSHQHFRVAGFLAGTSGRNENPIDIVQEFNTRNGANRRGSIEQFLMQRFDGAGLPDQLPINADQNVCVGLHVAQQRGVVRNAICLAG